MAFVQIIEFSTSKTEQLQQLAEEWEKATEGRRTVTRRTLCRDRDDPDRYFNIVFFDSYESAMANSALPETDAFSKRLLELVDAAPTFSNLDVVDDRS